MRVFLSSVIRGFEDFQKAARAAIESLGHEVILAEDFAASPSSAQISCLSGVREADAVVLLLGARYGELLQAGKSPTHEEFDEAKDSKPLFCFIQSGVTSDEKQQSLISEVQEWSTGSYTARYSSPEELRSVITTALHRWELGVATGQIDSDEMVERALGQLTEDDNRSSSRPALVLSLVGGPQQSILRPTQLEDDEFQRELIKRALFDEARIFDPGHGTEPVILEHALRLEQDSCSLTLSEDGSISINSVIVSAESMLPAIIEEEVTESLENILNFGSRLLGWLDPTEKLSHVAIAIGLVNSDFSAWKSQDGQRRNPTTMSVGRMYDSSPIRVTLSPPHRSRAELRQKRREIAEDFTALLRRQFSR